MVWLISALLALVTFIIALRISERAARYISSRERDRRKDSER